jgi:PAS domain S-box-containing protein
LPHLATAKLNAPLGLVLVGFALILAAILGTLLASGFLTRRVREAAAADRETLFRTLFDQIGDGILMIDSRGLIEAVNPAAEKMFGYSTVELVGRHVSLLMPPSHSGDHDNYLPSYLSTGVGTRIGVGREVEGRRKDGSVFPIDLLVREFHAGAAPHFTGVVRDISASRHAVETARRLAFIADSSSDAIVGSSVEGVVMSWNRGAEELFGFSAGEMIGKSVAVLMPLHRAHEVIEVGARIRRGERVVIDETERFTKSGQCIFVSISVSPIFDQHGNVVGTCGIARDISQRKQFEDRLHQSQSLEALGQFAGGIAHDFNNILNVINGFADLGLRSLDSADRSYRPLTQIKAAGERGAALTGQLLAFSRKQVMSMQVVNPNRIIESVRPLLARLLRENIQFSVHLRSTVPQVKVDPHQLGQVLMNLVINASDAMPFGGTLTIETSEISVCDPSPIVELKPGQYVVIAVRDTGTGMDPAVRSRIFEPFFTTKPLGIGTGLGLSTAFGIVNQSGGHIEVDSEPLSGTTMRVYLPATNEIALEEAEKTNVQSLEGRETLLVVEDDSGVREYELRVLRDFGYEVFEAADGGEALVIAEAQAGRIDLVVTDVVIPKFGGRELIEMLRETIPDLPILLVSGYAENAEVLSGILDRGTAFLAKPFSPEQLGVKVRELLERK